MKAFRIIGIVVASVIVLLGISIGVLYALFDAEKIKTELLKAVQEQHHRSVDVGNIQLSIWPNVGLKLEKLSVSEADSKTEFLSIESARVAVAVMPLLSKQVSVNAVELTGLKATLVKKKNGSLNIADLLGKPAEKTVGDKETKPADPAQAIKVDVASIKINNAHLTWRDEISGATTTLSNIDLSTGAINADSLRQTLAVDAVSLSANGKTGKGGNDSFEIKLRAPKLLVTAEKASGESLSVEASLAGAGRTLTSKLVLSGLEGNPKALKIAKLAFDLDAKLSQPDGETILKAHLDSPVAANISAQTLILEKIAGNLDVANPKMPMKQVSLPLSGNAQLDMLKQTAALQLSTQFDESKIATKVALAKFAPLAVGFDLDIDRLNVDKYLPPKSAAPEPTTAAVDQKLDFSPLQGLDINGAIRIGALQVAKIKLANVNAKLAIAGGKLLVSPLTLNLYEGSATGSLSLSAADHALSVKQTLSGISINPLMKDVVDKDLIEGRGNIVLDVNSKGETVLAMKKALAGSLALSLKDGAVKGINLAQSLRDIKAKLGAKQDTAQQAKATEKTDFSELSASFKINGGVAHNDDLSMKSPFLRLGGAGDIDLGANNGKGQMNYLAKASVVTTAGGQGGKDLEQLKGLTIPVRLSGPFDNLSYKIEMGDLVSEAAKAKIEEKKQEVKAKVEETVKNQVQDKLKGLFKK